MDTIFNYLYPKYNKDRNYVIVYLLPKIEKKNNGIRKHNKNQK